MKHTRLLEIIREEISSALNEEPNIDGPLDFTLKSPNEPITPDNINQGALQRSIDNAVEAIKKEYPEYNSNKLSNLIMKVNGQKPLKADSFSPEILKALKSVKDTIYQQFDIFGDDNEAKEKLSQFIKDYKKKNKSSDDKSPDLPSITPDGKTQLEKFLSGEKQFTDNIGYGQTETAVKKALGVKPKKAADIISTGSSTEKKPTSSKPKTEKPASTGKKGRPAGEPKTKQSATLTKGDDGFDTVEYSDDEGSAEAAKAAGSDETAKKLGNISTRKDKIVKAYQELQPQVKDKIDQAKAGDKESANWLKDKWTPILKAYNKAKEVKI